MKTIATNRKARYNYEIVETKEAGIVLTGSEVKSLRAGKVGFTDSYARIKNGELWLYNLNIPLYDKARAFTSDEPRRPRKLLMHRMEIIRLGRKIEQAGYTLIPFSIYFNDRGIVKLSLGLAKGRRTPDKKRHLMEQLKEREAQRALKKVIRGE